MAITERQASLLGALAVALVEALDAATGVDELLLAGEERMALVAEFEDLITGAGRPGLEGVAARTTDRDDVVVGVDVRLHRNLLVRIVEASGPDRRTRRSHSRLLGDLGKEFIVVAEGTESIDKQFQARGRVSISCQARQDPPKLPHHLQLLAIEQKLFVTGA